MKRVAWMVAGALWVGGAGAMAAQELELELGREVRVMEAPPWGALVEPQLTAHPVDPNWLVGGVIVQDTTGPGAERGYCGTLLSIDGGRSWETGRFPASVCADPMVAITRTGEAVYTALGPHETVSAPGPWPWGLLVARSADGGRTWNDSIIALGANHDKQALVVDPRPDQDRAMILVSTRSVRTGDRPVRSAIHVARTINGGRSFRHPTYLFPSNLNLNAGEIAMLADGTLLVSFVDFMRNVDNFRSREGMLERRRIWVYRSEDDGRTFSEPLFVSEHCARTSYLVADRSTGPHSGRVYMAGPAMDGPGILLHHSDDQGESWTSPIRVPGSGAGDTETTQPMLAVNPGGALGIAWIETTGGRAAACNRPLAAVSTDGGATFTEPVPLAPRSCPDPGRNGFAFRRWPFGGDYFGWTAASDGRFHAVWSDARRGAFELMGRSVRVR